MFRKALPLILLVVASATANAEKISGFVSGKPSGKTFTLGARGGPYTVDASKARVTMNGKFFSVSDLTGGSQATVEGTLKGKNMMATLVNIGLLRGAPKTTPTAPVVKKPKTTKPPVSTTPPAEPPKTVKKPKTTKAPVTTTPPVEPPKSVKKPKTTKPPVTTTPPVEPPKSVKKPKTTKPPVTTTPPAEPPKTVKKPSSKAKTKDNMKTKAKSKAKTKADPKTAPGDKPKTTGGGN